MNWLDKLPLPLLVVVAVLLGLAPLTPEPHLWEKSKMLFAGELKKPIDIFDFFLHGAPLALLILKVIRVLRVKRA